MAGDMDRMRNLLSSYYGTEGEDESAATQQDRALDIDSAAFNPAAHVTEVRMVNRLRGCAC